MMERLQDKASEGVNPFALGYENFREAMVTRLGLDRYASAELYSMAVRSGAVDVSALTRLPEREGLGEAVKQALVFPDPHLVTVKEADGVVKFTTRLHDGHEVESVVLPMLNHYTLCVSSQVGCKRGCLFCTTAKMGFVRDLTPTEILDQLYAARHKLSYPIRNIVFMGMGEPLDNFDAVSEAIGVMSDQRGFDIPLRRITVSTVGSAEGIEKLGASPISAVNLAVSVNGATDEIRSRLMPVNRKTPLKSLVETLSRYPFARKGALFAEYIVIEGVNDSPEDARALVAVLSPLAVRYNLIGFNAGPGAPFPSTCQKAVERFRDLLVHEGAYVRIRASKGRDLVAGCGQLGKKSVSSV
ncbi:23S rRNA (adenine(2503)-C(2))-methyltransferase RlmN [Desulfoluna spongiiphila]|uniref:23S rRNA (adenine(2503)-C(2))-methyltransferase RlmN n=1 Tax=Desulfoluna spongiiphila TaxID=419481 RepID=UPI001259CE18|nr:23S rRNA (adenine(2503)-C(2))-methyltransferase RlmN [Desulfoluna spongiiphila]VVS91160.1 ribosomal rna large subunit methyltransferase rlmn/cfr [Desulfoluna spongiiphila]